MSSTDEFPLSEGFEENADVSHNLAFARYRASAVDEGGSSGVAFRTSHREVEIRSRPDVRLLQSYKKADCLSLAYIRRACHR